MPSAKRTGISGFSGWGTVESVDDDSGAGAGSGVSEMGVNRACIAAASSVVDQAITSSIVDSSSAGALNHPITSGPQPSKPI
jgi:hypothetical protein